MEVPLFEDNALSQERLRTWPWTEASGYDAPQRFFLARLQRLQLLARVFQPTAPSDEWQRRLVHKAIYSTFRDCVALGLLKEAQTILQSQTPERDQIRTS